MRLCLKRIGMAMLLEIEKAKSRQQVAIEQLLSDESDNIRRAFNTFVRTVRDSTVLNRIVRYLRGDNIRSALDVITEYVTEFSNVLSLAFMRTARTEVNIARRASGDFAERLTAAKFTFNPGDKTTEAIMRRSQLQFIREFSTEQRDAVRTALQQSLRSGENPIQAARRFRDSIGLTRYQLNAVDNYRALLERGSVEALNRQLRDLRFDGTVMRAINQDIVLSQGQIDRMVERYSEKMLNYRANMISRTESMRTVSQASHAANWQMVDSVGADPTKVERTWISTLDSKVRDTHRAMHHQKVIGMDTPFVSSSGARLLHPGDPTAPASETIHCRCKVVILVPSNALPKQYDVHGVEKYSPDQARDYHGRWTSNGGSLTDEGGSVAAGKGVSRYEASKAAEKVSRHMAYNQSKINLSEDTRTFMLNGVEYTAAGDANIYDPDGKINLYINHLSSQSIEGVTAHEIEHMKFQGALNSYTREREAIWKDPGPPPDSTSENWYQRRGGNDAVVRPDGRPWPAYEGKYPAYTKMEDAFGQHSISEFAETDGVSDYSKEYWKGYRNGTVSSDIAMHETLAEMARIKYQTGKFPEHDGYRMMSVRGATAENYIPPPSKAAISAGQTRWRKLYRTVDEVYRG